ncbi:zf-HC2 domain-containing protein [Actinomadura sp. ATCC 31491]|uniref:Zf-HC2 domain-containing protein n=1 Tax=Actinomadura luzonensis TaxID=2805427 RepID=A0ABT0G6F4_9ACTN|nr:zf-HC2 domain-containing protein [Actinomadura luzonensis]MCK2220196.1 zf-HC2 domain-containing protein [Actinomadura luzonensis]
MKRFTCGELVEVITAYLDDALDEPSHAAVESHLACCADCGHYLDQYRATVRAVADQPPEKLSDRTRDRLMSAFRERRKP